MLFTKIKISLSLLDKRAKFLVICFSIVRIVISGLDTLGVILVGILLSKSANQFLTNSENSSPSLFNFLNFVNAFSLFQIAVFALFIFVAKSVLSSIFTKIMLDVLAEAESSIASKVFKRLLFSGQKTISTISSQDLIFALNYSAASAIFNLLSLIVSIFSEATLLITIAILFILIDAKVALAIITYFSIFGLLIYLVIGPKMQSIGKRFADSARGSSTSLNDAVLAYRELYTLRKQAEFSAKFSKGRISFAKSNAYAAFYTSLPRYIVETALMVGAVLLAAYIFRSNDPSTAVGLLGIFITGSMRLMASMLPLQNSLNLLRQIIAQSDPFFDLVNKTRNVETVPDLVETVPDAKPQAVSIEFKNVTFTYPGSEIPAIQNVTLDIPAGSYIALVGPSGSGKSTIADLIIKLLQPSTGLVTYSNIDQELARIGYVPQSPGIISGSILDNITLNVDSKEVDTNRLSAALEGSHLSTLIGSLKDGVNSDLGAQSDSLSGGQMQRIGLARALYSNPGLLVLDEATSALDAETESAITESLNKLKGSCTIVVIAHRLSTVQNADRVYVIEDGQIAASGKFSELAKTNELVAKYVELSKLNVD